MSTSNLRVVARDGQTVAPSPTALIGDFLLAASTTSALFHVVAAIDLTLSDSSLQSKWKQFAAHHLEQLQKHGKTWITEIWPDATIVPQAFINVANRTDAYGGPLARLLDSGDTGKAAALLDDLAGDIAEERGELAAYREKLNAAFEAASKYIAELTSGKGNIAEAIIADNKQVAALVDEVKKLHERIEQRVAEAREKIKWETAKFQAILMVFVILKDETRIVKDMFKQVLIVVNIGTSTVLKPEDFTPEQVAIMRKTYEMEQLARDVVSLTGLSAMIQSIAGAKPRLDVSRIESLLRGAEEKIKTAARSLRERRDVTGARAAFADFAAFITKLRDDCTHFQHAAVDAQKPPLTEWYAPRT